MPTCWRAAGSMPRFWQRQSGGFIDADTSGLNSALPGNGSAMDRIIERLGHLGDGIARGAGATRRARAARRSG